jgi:hypothetical protein
VPKPGTDLGAEIEFLVEATSPAPDAAALHSLAINADWEHVLEAAKQLGVAPLVWWRLKQHRVEAIPEPIVAQFRNLLRGTAARSLTLCRELHGLLDELERRGVPVIPLRGPVLAKFLYGEAAVRASADLDLLVRREDLQAVCETLRARGFRLAPELNAAQQALTLQQNCEFCFGGRNGISVEPHWELFPKSYPCDFPAEAVWTSARWTEFEGRRILQPSPEHSFFLLCVHAAKHRWLTLQQVADIAWFMHAQVLNGAELRQLAERAGASRALATSCWLAEKVMGVSAPAGLWPGEGVWRQASEIGLRVIASWRNGTPRSALADLWFTLRVLDRWQHKVICAYYTLLAPTTIELQILPLPRLLSPLYYPLRAGRLIVKHALKPALRGLLQH